MRWELWKLLVYNGIASLKNDGLMGWFLYGFTSIFAGIILDMGSADERRWTIVTSSLIGWVHTQNYPCMTLPYLLFELIVAELIVAQWCQTTSTLVGVEGSVKFQPVHNVQNSLRNVRIPIILGCTFNQVGHAKIIAWVPDKSMIDLEMPTFTKVLPGTLQSNFKNMSGTVPKWGVLYMLRCEKVSKVNIARIIDIPLYAVFCVLY